MMTIELSPGEIALVALGPYKAARVIACLEKFEIKRRQHKRLREQAIRDGDFEIVDELDDAAQRLEDAFEETEHWLAQRCALRAKCPFPPKRHQKRRLTVNRFTDELGA